MKNRPIEGGPIVMRDLLLGDAYFHSLTVST